MRLGAAAYAGVERVDRGDFLASELEVEDVEVLGDPGPTVWHAALTIRPVTFQHAGPGERR